MKIKKAYESLKTEKFRIKLEKDDLDWSKCNLEDDKNNFYINK